MDGQDGDDLDPHDVAETKELHEVLVQVVEALSPKNRMATLFFYYDILERKGSLISIGNLGDSGQGPPSQVEGPTEIAATAKQPRNGRSNEGRPAPSEHKPQYKAGIRPHNAPKDYFDVFVRHCQKLQERGKNPQVHLRLVSSE